MNGKRATLIAIAGGTASGKTTVATKISDSFSNKNVFFWEMDNYYRDLSHLSPEERKKVNFDHPDSVDIDLMVCNLTKLLNNESIEEPIYDFKVNNRKKEVRIIEPTDIIILDGIFALENSEVRALSDIKIFVDTDADTRLLRRIVRDVEDRGRTLKSVIEQYTKYVKPMHEAFIAPTKRYADLIIPFDFHNTVAIDLIATKIKSIIK